MSRIYLTGLHPRAGSHRSWCFKMLLYSSCVLFSSQCNASYEARFYRVVLWFMTHCSLFRRSFWWIAAGSTAPSGRWTWRRRSTSSRSASSGAPPRMTTLAAPWRSTLGCRRDFDQSRYNQLYGLYDSLELTGILPPQHLWPMLAKWVWMCTGSFWATGKKNHVFTQMCSLSPRLAIPML